MHPLLYQIDEDEPFALELVDEFPCICDLRLLGEERLKVRGIECMELGLEPDRLIADLLKLPLDRIETPLVVASLGVRALGLRSRLLLDRRSGGSLGTLIEIAAVAVLGFIPDSAPFQISQIIVNVICSMQYNTFRQADGIPMATTFCTNHVRQVGVFFTKGIRHRESAHFKRSLFHAGMLALFTLGGVTSTITCNLFGGRGVWFAVIPLGLAFFDLLYADLHTEKGEMARKPKGH